MITIISGTNRPNSKARQFSLHYYNTLKSITEEEVHLIDLSEIEHSWFHPDMYEKETMVKGLKRIQDNYLIPAEKFIYVVPEYNGSFPGVLKLFIDACSIRKYKATFKDKKAALVGIATGRAGNLRGLEHLTGILNHVGTVIYPNRLPISSIENLVDENGKITDVSTLKAIKDQLEGFLDF